LIKKIVIIGPESTGKSTLCELLAEHYNSVWVEEFAREYLLQNGTTYSFENLLDIAKGQINLEEKAIKNLSNASHSNTAPLFIDTDMYVMKVWGEFVFERCHHWVLNTIAERKYDLYLLCDIDLPWEKDELREYPDIKSREKLYHHYKDILLNQSVPFVYINGSYDERLLKAVNAINKILH